MSIKAGAVASIHLPCREETCICGSRAQSLPSTTEMETSAARSLTLVCFLLAVSGCETLQLHSPVGSLRRTLRSLPEPRREETVNIEVPEGPRRDGNGSTDVTATARLQNVTVPHFLRELLEEPVSHLGNVNSIRTYENQAINESESLLHSSCFVAILAVVLECLKDSWWWLWWHLVS